MRQSQSVVWSGQMGCARFIAMVRNARSFVCVVAMLVPIFSGCSSDQVTVWSTQAPSPDGQWIAIGRTDQYSGPGNAASITGVYLRPAGSSHPADPILHFDDNFPPGKGGIELTLVWLSPTHLQVTFSRHPNLNFQVVKYAGIDISVRDLPSEVSPS